MNAGGSAAGTLWQNRRMIPWLGNHSPFPPVETALRDPNGLLAASAELTTGTLLRAYRQGIFPWYEQGQPVLWWSPDPRMVLRTSDLRVSRSLRKVTRRQRFEIRVDTAFREVMQACADMPRDGQDGTWISDEVIDAYTELHGQGYAHSIEAWREGELVGGLYGVAIGRMFFGESMFSRQTDASKVALVHLVALLRSLDMPLIDCQQETGHLASMGGRAMPRRAFAEKLAGLVDSPPPTVPWALALPVDAIG